MTIRKVLEVQGQFWKSLKFAVDIPTLGGGESAGVGCENSGNREGTPAAVSDMQSGGDGKPEQAAEPEDAKGTGAEAGPSSGGEELGACGGAWRPNTVADVLKMQGVEQLYAVQPLGYCPHLSSSVKPLLPEGLDTGLPCEDCGDTKENWVCLTCYKVFCSRYVKEHMLFHSVAEEHVMVLSYSDLSVWCYACNDYVDNPTTFAMKNAAHCHKFGEPLPGAGPAQ